MRGNEVAEYTDRVEVRVRSGPPGGLINPWQYTKERKGRTRPMRYLKNGARDVNATDPFDGRKRESITVRISFLRNLRRSFGLWDPSEQRTKSRSPPQKLRFQGSCSLNGKTIPIQPEVNLAPCTAGTTERTRSPIRICIIKFFAS